MLTHTELVIRCCHEMYDQLRRVIVKSVKLVDLTEMRKTDSFGETGLVSHVSSSS